jgi:hypothetical protein
MTAEVSQTINPVAAERYLKGLNFPANKKNLIDRAKINQAPQEIIRLLKQVADKNYTSPIEITKEMSKIE